MTPLMETIQPTIDHIRKELAEQGKKLGMTEPNTLTGNMLFVEEIDAVWFETEYKGTTCWVTADMEERADWGETLVYAADRDEALHYDESN